MDKILEKTLLYDFYGELLTERQRQVYESVVFNDLSLGEAAACYGISRQGIHDMIRRCDEALSGYERKLGFVEKSLRTAKDAARIKELVSQYRATEDQALLAQAEELAAGLEQL